MDWVGETVRSLAVVGVTATATWVIAKWRARRAAAQWRFEKVTDTLWTLRRDSPKTAFNLHVWSEGDAEKAGTIHVVHWNERLDVRSGELIDVDGVSTGAVVVIDWVEGERRVAVRTRIRDSTQMVDIVRKDLTSFRR